MTLPPSLCLQPPSLPTIPISRPHQGCPRAVCCPGGCRAGDTHRNRYTGTRECEGGPAASLSISMAQHHHWIYIPPRCLPCSRAELSDLFLVALVLPKMLPFPLSQARKREGGALPSPRESHKQRRKLVTPAYHHHPPPPGMAVHLLHATFIPTFWLPTRPIRPGGQSGAMTQSVWRVAEQVLHGEGFPQGQGYQRPSKGIRAPPKTKAGNFGVSTTDGCMLLLVQSDIGWMTMKTPLHATSRPVYRAAGGYRKATSRGGG